MNNLQNCNIRREFFHPKQCSAKRSATINSTKSTNIYQPNNSTVILYLNEENLKKNSIKN